MIRILDVRLRFGDDRINRLMSQARKRALMKAGQFLRRAARTGIRRSSKPSSPGQPVHTQTGFFKEAIRYEYDTGMNAVVVGPAYGDPDIMRLHESGGSRQLVEWSRRGSKKWRPPGWRPRGRGAERTGRTMQVRYPDRSYLVSALEKAKRDLLAKFPEAFREAFGSPTIGPSGSAL